MVHCSVNVQKDMRRIFGGDVRARYFWRFSVLVCILYAASPAWGIILHPDHEPDPVTWVERPDNNVIGRWGDNASCVVVSPHYVITTRHQTYSDSNVPGIKITIAGTEYTIDKFFTHPSADLRLVRLNNANLAEYVSVNFDPNEVNQVAVLGGYGDGRQDPPLPEGYLPLEIFKWPNRYYTYGYYWDDSSNTIQRWGTNNVVSTSSYTSELIVSQFDEALATEYECTIGDHDSGGGWFLPASGGWKVIGLNRGVIGFDPGQSRFLYTNGVSIPTQIAVYPDSMSMDSIAQNHLDAVRISFYAEWIIETMYASELQNLAVEWLRDDCDVENNYCNGADVVDIGVVNLADFAAMSSVWLENRAGP